MEYWRKTRSYWLELSSIRGLQFFNLVRFSTAILIGICLAKSAEIGLLSLVEISEYEALLFFGMLMTFFWIMGSENALVAYLPKLSDQQRRGVYPWIIGVYFAVSTVLVGALYIWEETLISTFSAFTVLPFFSLFLVSQWLSVPAALVHLIYVLEERPQALIRYGVLTFGLQLVGTGLLLVFGYQLEALIWWLILIATMRIIWLFWQVLHFREKTVAWSLVTPWLWGALPLMLQFIIGRSTEYLDQLIVGNLFDNEEMFIIYRYGAREFPLFPLLVMGVVVGGIQLAAQNLAKAHEQILQEIIKMGRLLFPIAIVLVLIAPWAFPFFYSDNFSLSAQIFNVYLLTLIFRLIVPHVYMIALGNANWVLIISILEVIVNVVSSYWLAQYFGVIGIAFGTVVAYCFEKICTCSFVYFRYGIRPRQYFPLGEWALGSLMLIAAYVGSSWLYAV